MSGPDEGRRKDDMGRAFEARCSTCGHKFEASNGVGGVSFLEFRCNTCGETKCIPCPNRSDTFGKTTAQTEAEWERWRAELKQMDLRCTCGGEHSSSAPLRCPKCGSTDVAEGRTLVCYD